MFDGRKGAIGGQIFFNFEKFLATPLSYLLSYFRLNLINMIKIDASYASYQHIQPSSQKNLLL